MDFMVDHQPIMYRGDHVPCFDGFPHFWLLSISAFDRSYYIIFRQIIMVLEGMYLQLQSG